MKNTRAGFLFFPNKETMVGKGSMPDNFLSSAEIFNQTGVIRFVKYGFSAAHPSSS